MRVRQVGEKRNVPKLRPPTPPFTMSRAVVDESLTAIEYLDERVDQVQNDVLENASTEIAPDHLPGK